MELVTLNSEQLKELQNKNLEIAEYLSNFCRDHGIRVFLHAGALLGAVRHKGFVPWDDDIDMCFPALDWKKFIETWEKYGDKERYSLCIQSRTYNDHRLSSSLKDNNTTFITSASVDIDCNQGLGLDLGPLHAVPESRIEQTLQWIFAAGRSLFKASRLPNRQSKPIYIASKVLLGIFKSDDVRYKIWSTLERWASKEDKNYDKHEFVREFGLYPYIKWLFRREWFDEIEWVPFEHTQLPIPKGAKEYLKKRYGNFMELPPEKDRHPEHKIVFMDLKTPYKEYRGTKYFVNGGKKNG